MNRPSRLTSLCFALLITTALCSPALAGGGLGKSPAFYKQKAREIGKNVKRTFGQQLVGLRQSLRDNSGKRGFNRRAQQAKINQTQSKYAKSYLDQRSTGNKAIIKAASEGQARHPGVKGFSEAGRLASEAGGQFQIADAAMKRADRLTKKGDTRGANRSRRAATKAFRLGRKLQRKADVELAKAEAAASSVSLSDISKDLGDGPGPGAGGAGVKIRPDSLVRRIINRAGTPFRAVRAWLRSRPIARLRHALANGDLTNAREIYAEIDQTTINTKSRVLRGIRKLALRYRAKLILRKRAKALAGQSLERGEPIAAAERIEALKGSLAAAQEDLAGAQADLKKLKPADKDFAETQTYVEQRKLDVDKLSTDIATAQKDRDQSDFVLGAQILGDVGSGNTKLGNLFRRMRNNPTNPLEAMYYKAMVNLGRQGPVGAQMARLMLRERAALNSTLQGRELNRAQAVYKKWGQKALAEMEKSVNKAVASGMVNEVAHYQFHINAKEQEMAQALGVEYKGIPQARQQRQLEQAVRNRITIAKKTIRFILDQPKRAEQIAQLTLNEAQALLAIAQQANSMLGNTGKDGQLLSLASQVERAARGKRFSPSRLARNVGRFLGNMAKEALLIPTYDQIAPVADALLTPVAQLAGKRVFLSRAELRHMRYSTVPASARQAINLLNVVYQTNQQGGAQGQPSVPSVQGNFYERALGHQ
ncbi:MAG: hypothetical protein H6707_02685 [Deltaproteobacteria bacterium]|nr:hypothetical protein [Deltaproteobacteria bacterium]